MKILLDLDTGIDDGMALAYALGNPDIELIGVVGTYGNVYTEDGVQNVLNILNMFNKHAIPVYKGSTHSLKKDNFERLNVSARIHGENGVGQVKLETSNQLMENQDGIDFIIDSIKKYKKELTIVATGPMTNIAAVIEKEPKILNYLGKVIIMGGALTVPGNASPYSEANIFQDPYAAKVLFESGADVTMVGLDVTQRSQLTKEDTQNWRFIGSTSGKNYADMVDYYIEQHEHSNGTACYLHDPSAVICATHPEFFTMLPMYMTVITDGEDSGRTIGDPKKLRNTSPNVKVCVNVKADELEKHLNEIFLKLFSMKGE